MYSVPVSVIFSALIIGNDKIEIEAKWKKILGAGEIEITDRGARK